LAYSTRFAEEILDQLATVDGLTSRKTFSALGLYSSEAIFGLIADETLYLRLDEAGFVDLQRLGGKALRPVERKPEIESSAYVSVPLEIIEHRDALLAWVGRAIEAGPAA
jgi:DNA transformation protein and related proteins